MENKRIEIVYLLLTIPLLMVLATVFVVSTNLANGIVSGKYFWFYISLGAISIASLIACYIKKNILIFSFIDILIFLFFLIGVIVTYYHEGEVTNKLVLFILCYVLYYSSKILLNSSKWSVFIIPIFIMTTGLIEVIWGLKQLYGYSSSQHNLFKTTGSFFNPGPYAGYLAAIIPLALYYVLKDYSIFSRKPKTLYITFYIRWSIAMLTLVGILTVLPATMSRGAWVAALIGSLFVLRYTCFDIQKVKSGVKNYFKSHKFKSILILSFSTAIIISAIVALYLIKKDSADGRALIWKISTQTIIQHPLGVGLGNFSGTYGDVQAAYFASNKYSDVEQYVAGNPEYGFNEYLQMTIELGIIPCILFIALFIAILAKGIKRKSYPYAGGILSILVFALFSYPFSQLSIIILLLVYTALCTVCKQNKKLGKVKKVENYKINITAIWIFILLAVTMGSLINRYPTYNAYKKWNRAKIIYNTNLHADSAKEYQKLEPYLNYEIQFLFEYAQSLSKAEQFEESNAILKKAMKISCDPMLYNIRGKNNQALKDYDEAERNFLKAANIVPGRLYPYYLLAKLYDEMEQPERVCRMSEVMKTKEIKIHSPAIDEMRDEINKICNNY